MDHLLGEEEWLVDVTHRVRQVQLIIRSPGLAYALNDFLEILSNLRREHDVSYRCADDIDFLIGEPEPGEGGENRPGTLRRVRIPG